ncbi:hypothetical protein GCM10009775_00680 [Microbacterium aoyamense]|uniref:Uncharacterized protein n=1 Tax=Microbacterium aoyamense TaxID=344166 RepID=A0ABP5AEQ8_9MICO|nr:hypothetical protein [Microbacterium aoyamense]
MEEPWIQDAAEALDRITRDPMADAVPGRVTILSVAAPDGRGRYRECSIELRAEASGVDARTIGMAVVFDTRALPPAGTVLPARISRSHPDAVEVDWDALAR